LYKKNHFTLISTSSRLTDIHTNVRTT